MTLRTGILSCLAFLVLAAPASAVVGGTPQSAAEVPWYADVGVCGGTLIAPDRVMTAEHCVRDRARRAAQADQPGVHAHLGKARGNDGEHFRGSTMLGAIDVDGKPPLSSGCNGDSGGPLYTGPASAPRILGVVSYRVRKRDRSRRLRCLVEGGNRGGPAPTEPDSVSVPR